MLEGSPPPLKQVCRDGMEVKVYRMLQLELYKWEALTTLLLRLLSYQPGSFVGWFIEAA